MPTVPRSNVLPSRPNVPEEFLIMAAAVEWENYRERNPKSLDSIKKPVELRRLFNEVPTGREDPEELDQGNEYAIDDGLQGEEGIAGLRIKRRT